MAENKIGAEGLISRVEEFFCSPSFTTSVGDFLSSKAGDIEFKDLEEEQPHINFATFQEYQQMVERNLQSFLASEGISQKAVVDACLEAQNSGSGYLTCIDYILACTEYEEFMQLAYDYLVASSEPIEREVENGEGDGGNAPDA